MMIFMYPSRRARSGGREGFAERLKPLLERHHLDLKVFAKHLYWSLRASSCSSRTSSVGAITRFTQVRWPLIFTRLTRSWISSSSSSRSCASASPARGSGSWWSRHDDDDARRHHRLRPPRRDHHPHHHDHLPDARPRHLRRLLRPRRHARLPRPSDGPRDEGHPRRPRESLPEPHVLARAAPLRAPRVRPPEARQHLHLRHALPVPDALPQVGRHVRLRRRGRGGRRHADPLLRDDPVLRCRDSFWFIMAMFAGGGILYGLGILQCRAFDPRAQPPARDSAAGARGARASSCARSRA